VARLPVSTLLSILAVFGAAALVLRLVRSGFRIIGRLAETAAAAALAQASAQRGDLTGMQEARAVERRARSRRLAAMLSASGWLVWLLLPPLLGALPLAYALASPLWLVARGRSAPLPDTSERNQGPLDTPG
jgi:hypothetical protein